MWGSLVYIQLKLKLKARCQFDCILITMYINREIGLEVKTTLAYKASQDIKWSGVTSVYHQIFY